MKIKTPFLAGLHLKTLGKKRLGSAQRMVNELARLKQKNLSQLSESKIKRQTKYEEDI